MRPRRFPVIAAPHAQPLSAKAWRAQADTGKLRWQKVTLRLQQPKTVEVAWVRETMPQAWRRPEPERWLLIERHGAERYKYYLSNAPHRTSVRTLLTWAQQRW